MWNKKKRKFEVIVHTKYDQRPNHESQTNMFSTVYILEPQDVDNVLVQIACKDKKLHYIINKRCTRNVNNPWLLDTSPTSSEQL